MSGIELWSEALQWLVLLAVAGMTAGLVYLVADLSRRLGPDPGPLIPGDGLELETEAPPLVATELRTGKTVQLSDYAGQTAVVVFLSPSCKPCWALVPDLNRLAKSRRGVPFIVVVLAGKGVDYPRHLEEQIMVVGDPEKKLQEAYEVQRTPLVYFIDEEGKVAMRTVSNDLLDLEDTLDGIGRPQGSMPWVSHEEERTEEAGEQA